MASPATNPNQRIQPTSVRSLRVVGGAMLAASFVYIYVAEMLVANRTEPMQFNRVFLIAFGSISVALGVAVFVIRQTLIADAREGAQADDMGAMVRWRAGHIVAFAMSEAIVLFGFVTRFLGAPRLTAAVFYAAGILLLVITWLGVSE